MVLFFFFFSSRRRHTRWTGDWSSDVCSSDLRRPPAARGHLPRQELAPGLHALPEALLPSTARERRALGLQPPGARLAHRSGLLRRARRCARRRRRLPRGPARAAARLARGQAQRPRLLALRLPRHGGLHAPRVARRVHRLGAPGRERDGELLRALPRPLSGDGRAFRVGTASRRVALRRAVSRIAVVLGVLLAVLVAVPGQAIYHFANIDEIMSGTGGDSS